MLCKEITVNVTLQKSKCLCCYKSIGNIVLLIVTDTSDRNAVFPRNHYFYTPRRKVFGGVFQEITISIPHVEKGLGEYCLEP